MKKTELTIDEARKIKASRLSVLAPRCPLRFWPAIIHGPHDGYLVVELGFAVANEMPEVK